MAPAARKRSAPPPPPDEPPAHPHVAAAEAYVDGVLSGDILACKWVRLACQRHRDDLARAEACDPDFPYFFEKDLAERTCRFVERMPHIKGRWAARKQMLQLEPWQCFIECMVFGWRRADGKRRFRRVYVEVPRKNAKSTLTAANGLFMFCADGEYGAEVYSGATSEKQAWEVFGPARLMAKGRPALLRQFGISINAKNLNIGAKACKFEPLIGKPGDGASPSCAIVDEYHEHATSEQADTMLTGMGAREQPLLWIITTAGDNVAGPCYDHVLTGRKVLEQTIEDEEFFYLEYGIDEGDDWTDPAVLAKANPNIGISVNEDYLLARQREAIRNPREQGRFKTKNLNCWVNSRSAYFNMARWASCRTAPALEDMPPGADCYLGLDLASKVDIAALEIIFPNEDGTCTRHGFAYLPEATVEDPANSHYAAWRIDGRLVVTDGEVTDYGRIRDDILDLCSRFRVVEVAYDPFQATMLVSELMAENVPVVEFRPTVLTMSEPMKHLDALLASSRLRHDCGPNDPMTWMMSNVVAKADAKDNVYPRKEKAELKIDGPVALMMAIGRMMAAEASEAGAQMPEIHVW